MNASGTMWTETDSLIMALASYEDCSDDIVTMCDFCGAHSECLDEFCTASHTRFADPVEHTSMCPVVRARAVMAERGN